MFRIMIRNINKAIKNSPQHFCFKAAIEYPTNMISTENRSAGLHHDRISMSNPNQRSSKFILNPKYYFCNIKVLLQTLVAVLAL